MHYIKLSNSKLTNIVIYIPFSESHVLEWLTGALTCSEQYFPNFQIRRTLQQYLQLREQLDIANEPCVQRRETGGLGVLP